jgi:hypothetical protein
LQECGKWQAEKDEKLNTLIQLLQENHPQEKVLIFTQFADTVNYLITELKHRRIEKIAGVTGNSADPAAIAWRFSPRSNGKKIASEVEKIIKLRSRLRQRLQENAEVVGTDEAFFEEDLGDRTLLDLYHEKSGILDGEEDTEVDLTSEAYQIWQNAIDADPFLQKTIETLPNVVYSTLNHRATATHPNLSFSFATIGDRSIKSLS